MQCLYLPLITDIKCKIKISVEQKHVKYIRKLKYVNLYKVK